MINRHLQSLVIDALQYARIVALVGPRQVGKTTLTQQLPTEIFPATFYTLDDERLRQFALDDPVGFIQQLRKPAILDEIQHAPGIMLELKRLVDSNPAPGQFVVTGSVDLLRHPQLVDSLAGRIDYFELFPFSQAELHNKNKQKASVIDRLFAQDFTCTSSANLDAEIAQMVVAGGYPEALQRPSAVARGRWFAAYIRLLLAGELSGLADIQAFDDFESLLKLVASQSGARQQAVSLANDLNISAKTVSRYISMMQMLYLVHRVPVWRKNLGQRIIKSPKLYYIDSGLAAHLAGISEAHFSTRREQFGMLFETFVAAELRKQLGWSTTQVSLFYWRTAGGREVDFILERQDGAIFAIEVKATATPHPRHIRHLNFLRTTLKDQFQGGILLYTGDQVMPLADRVWAVPASILW